MTGASESQGLIGAMATPAVLLLGNAMLILSTNQRLQSILARLRELQKATERRAGGGGTPGEGNGAPERGVDDPLVGRFLELAEIHERRARFAHRALLAFYLSGALFVGVVLLIGTGGFGLSGARTADVWAAVAGCLLLLVGVTQLAVETWLGIGATDRQFRTLTGLDGAGD